MLESTSSLGEKSWLASAPLEGALKEAVERVKNAVEKEKIARALRAADGDAAQAAKALGIGAKTFAAKCRAHGIS
jgi:DNA-binding NtrC family response regulator